MIIPNIWTKENVPNPQPEMGLSKNMIPLNVIVNEHVSYQNSHHGGITHFQSHPYPDVWMLKWNKNLAKQSEFADLWAIHIKHVQ